MSLVKFYENWVVKISSWSECGFNFFIEIESVGIFFKGVSYFVELFELYGIFLRNAWDYTLGPSLLNIEGLKLLKNLFLVKGFSSIYLVP